MADPVSKQKIVDNWLSLIINYHWLSLIIDENEECTVDQSFWIAIDKKEMRREYPTSIQKQHNNQSSGDTQLQLKKFQ